MIPGLFKHPADNYTKAQICTMDLHWAIHMGKVFNAHYDFTGVTASGGTGNFLLKIGNKKSNHIILNTDAANPYGIKLFYTPDLATNGSLVTAKNQNFYYINTVTDATYYATPTFGAGGIGTEWEHKRVSGGKKIGGQISLSNEVVFAHDNNFIIQVINNHNQDQDIFLDLLIIEVGSNGYM